MRHHTDFEANLWPETGDFFLPNVDFVHCWIKGVLVFVFHLCSFNLSMV